MREDIPDEFIREMGKVLPDKELKDFMASLSAPGIKSLRINPLKKGSGSSPTMDLISALPAVPWEPWGRYFESLSFPPGKNPLHESGAYYIQEASAMAPAGSLMREPGIAPEPQIGLEPRIEPEARIIPEPGIAPESQIGLEPRIEPETRKEIKGLPAADYDLQGAGASKGLPESGNTGIEYRVLDLAAAPGGKSTQLAALMGGRGLLISNEIVSSRAKILSENIERLAITNAIVLNESPERLSERFPGFFDRILLDAPCSGEGMFRKNENAIDNWSYENVKFCADRQYEILSHAAKMLSGGGRIVYSTCTFSIEENEGVIGRFLSDHRDYSIEKLDRSLFGLDFEDCGLPSLTRKNGNGAECGANGESLLTDEARALQAAADHAVRLYPHRVKGEGHFFVSLIKDGGSASVINPEHGVQKADGRDDIGRRIDWRTHDVISKADFASKSDLALFHAFEREALSGCRLPPGNYIMFGSTLFIAPSMTPSLKGLKVLRPGLELGAIKKNRFEPSHALALFLSPDEVLRSVELSSEKEAISFLHGETLNRQGQEKGWCLVSYEGFSLGWGRSDGRLLKNHYPKGLRIKY